MGWDEIWTGTITEATPSWIYQTGRAGIAIGCHRDASQYLKPEIEYIVEERPVEKQNALVPL
jgi:hypothetical protein